MEADVNKDDAKRKATSPPVTDVQRRYLWSTEELIKDNKYHVLQAPEVSDAIPSASSFTDEPSPPVPPKIKVPPIFLATANYPEVLKDLKTLAKQDFITRNTANQIRINLNSIEDYRTVTKFFKDNKINFYSYQDPDNKPLSVVIKNVPASLNVNYIEEELADFPVRKVTRILNRQKQPSLTVAVELDNNQKAKDIFKLERLCYAVVRVEPRKYENIPQCFKCQRFGHTKNYCQMEPRCVKCLGNHLYQNCTKTADTPPTCTNCKEPHPANYRGCKHYLSIKNARNIVNRQVQTQQPQSSTQPDSRQAPNTNIPQRANASHASYVPYASYANATTNQPNIPPRSTHSQIPLPQSQNPIMDQILTFILNLITPYIDQIKKFFIDNIFGNFFNGTK